jgi:23S rRNA (uridine2552-2'-O)-methyltransferase
MSKPRELHDRYFRLAKAEGYLARSAYKLKQIQQRYRVLRRGDWVLDLGCAPGSWMQVASEIVGESGLVVGIDLLPAKLAATDRIAVLLGDAFAVPPSELLALLPEPRARFNAVISDMAPNTVGIGDDLRSASLCRRVLGLLPSVLAEGGRLTMKIFEGAEYSRVLNEARSMFTYCKGYRPDATREISREMFIVGEGFHAPTRTGTHAPAGPPAPAAGWGGGVSAGSPITPGTNVTPSPIARDASATSPARESSRKAPPSKPARKITPAPAPSRNANANTKKKATKVVRAGKASKAGSATKTGNVASSGKAGARKPVASKAAPAKRAAAPRGVRTGRGGASRT